MRQGLAWIFLVSINLILSPAALAGTASFIDADTGLPRCGTLTPQQMAELEREHQDITWRRLERPGPTGIRTHSAPPGEDDPYAGIVPADYVNPVAHVREVGHLNHEIEVQVTSEWQYQHLENVLSFRAPDWARMMLVEFVPDSGNQRAGLYLRPHSPFIEGSFHEPGAVPSSQQTRLRALAYEQASFRSEGRSTGMTQYVLVTRDMDPAPAGLDWHVALGQFRDHVDLSGTLRVWFSGSGYRPPLAVEFFYDADEEADQVGFFDPTPRTPDGDNPGTTVGEAWRWILFKATEQLLDDLGFNGFFPVRILVTTADTITVGPNGGNATGVASSNVGIVEVAPNRPAPGRLRARPAGKLFEGNDGWLSQHRFRVPVPAWEREAGTDACRALMGERNLGMCSDPAGALVDSAGQAGATQGWIRLRRNISDTWDWDLNLHDQPGWPDLARLIQHEVLHVLGFSAPIQSQAYMASFEPPRPFLDRPMRPVMEIEEGDPWYLTGSRRHHYGPAASPSGNNPWRNTTEPGPRLQDNDVLNLNHLMPEDGDELAQWNDATRLMDPGSGGLHAQGPGIAREILLDVGYALNTWAIQDRRLPRHWYDPERSGHGIDLRRVEFDDGELLHFLHFYTYDEQGDPEWYLAVAEIGPDAVLEGTLEYYTYEEGRYPPQQIDPARSGTFRLDLDPAFDDPACADRRPFTSWGNERWLFAVFEWQLPGSEDTGRWCLEPLRFGREPAFPDEGSGSWFAADQDDVGWGLSVLTRNYGPRPIVNTIAYYYDAMGEPTWAWGVAGGDYSLPYGSISDGVEMEMLHFHGFCRTCEPVEPQTESAGELRMRINAQTTAPHAGNRIMRLELNDRGATGGQWLRENIGIMLLSSPHPAMSQ